MLTLFKEQYQHIAFTCKADEEEILIKSDPNILEQVMINIVKNGSEAIEDSKSGSIAIKLKSYSKYTRISITDNGGGIDPEIQDQIFIPFYTTKSKGSGIGLSLSRRLINILGGEISFATSSAGTFFIIEI